MIDRLPPQNIDSEQAVLGSVLIDRDAIVEIADFLRPEDFYRQAHGKIYSVMVDLFSRMVDIDVVTVAEALERTGDLESIGGAAYLSLLGNDTPTAVHVEQYARIVERKALHRALIGAAGRIAAIGYEDGPDATEALDRAQSELMAVTSRTASCWRALGELMPGAYEHIAMLHDARELLGVPSGFGALDRLTGGFMPGDLVVLAARPSVGKSAMALQMAQYAARLGRGVGFFSLEMSAESLALRALAGGAGIDTHDRIESEAFVAAAELAAQLRSLPLWIDDTPKASVMDLRTRARRLACLQGDLRMLVVDYLQLTSGLKTDNREREVADVSRGLKALAREMRVPVIALCQLNRRPEDRDTQEPRLSDLRDSGSIEQDADMVLFLWRAGRDSKPVEPINLTLAKHRNGPSHLVVPLVFNRKQTRFFEEERDHGQPYGGDH